MNKNKQDHCKLKLIICLFGNFKITYNGITITENIINSYMVTKLFAYLILHRDRIATSQELIEALWENDESINPVGALKNLVYRLRTVLEKCFGNHQYIYTFRGGYQWSDDVEVSVDLDDFERICKSVQFMKNDEQKIIEGKKALEIYDDILLRSFNDGYWFITTKQYYYSLYIDMVRTMAKAYIATKNYSCMEQLAKQAIKYDIINEQLHCYLIEAYLYQGKTQYAYNEYKNTCDIIYKKIGAGPGKELQSLYDKMMSKKNTLETDISRIQISLSKEAENISGAFLCDYGVFKKNYALELKRSKRDNKELYLILLTIKPKLQYRLDSAAYSDTVLDGITKLESILIQNLRAGDMISRYSKTQFIIMLADCNYEDATMIMSRIDDRFNKMYINSRIKIIYSFNNITTDRTG